MAAAPVPAPAVRSRWTGAGALGLLLVYALFAPMGLAALPLAALVVAGRHVDRGTVVLFAFAAGLGIWWLLTPGDLPDQTTRAAGLMATLAFVTASLLTRWTLVHRALVSTVLALAGVGILYSALGWTWSQLRWWAEFRTGASLRMALGVMNRLTRPRDAEPAGPGSQFLEQVEAALPATIRAAADFFPAMLSLQLLAGIVLAAVLLQWTSGRSVGRPPDRFVDFRFSEHLGWIAAVALLVLLLPATASLKLLAANVLVVMAVLYAVRGVAVTRARILAARGGCLVYLLAGAAVVFVLPVVVGGAIVLGVLDTRMDLRKRWESR